jgi:hypothetical protein
MPFMDTIGSERGEIIGYTTMVAAFLMVFFGIRSYRDNVLNGSITFGRGFQVGILIALIASACYVATWEVIYHTTAPDFAEQYASSAIEKARAAGASEVELNEKRAEMAKFSELYRNPLFNVGITFLEVFPVGLVMTLVSAGMLSRRRAQDASLPAAT